ncbi:hypothetical protein Ciccas_010776 [Cichlidogyrus casuarinus]|uniref:Uncharacterized protein n=1 Tax=Cichlidogyrus casuarinus TaxID=1844966 RepID=A0ABD2PUB6_9PLAT
MFKQLSSESAKSVESLGNWPPPGRRQRHPAGDSSGQLEMDGFEVLGGRFTSYDQYNSSSSSSAFASPDCPSPMLDSQRNFFALGNREEFSQTCMSKSWIDADLSEPREQEKEQCFASSYQRFNLHSSLDIINHHVDLLASSSSNELHRMRQLTLSPVNQQNENSENTQPCSYRFHNS